MRDKLGRVVGHAARARGGDIGGREVGIDNKATGAGRTSAVGQRPCVTTCTTPTRSKPPTVPAAGIIAEETTQASPVAAFQRPQTRRRRRLRSRNRTERV